MSSYYTSTGAEY